MISRACAVQDSAREGSRNATGTGSYRRGVSGFLRCPLLGLGGDHTGALWAVQVHLQTPLWASPQPGLEVSAAQKHNSGCAAGSFSFFDPHVWGQSYVTHRCCIPPHRVLKVHFRYLNSRVKHMYAWSALPSVYLGEKVTPPPMSQALRASAALWSDHCCFDFFGLLKPQNHQERWLHSAPPPDALATQPRLILFIKERFPLESERSRCVFSNKWRCSVASGRHGGFRKPPDYSLVEAQRKHLAVVKVDKPSNDVTVHFQFRCIIQHRSGAVTGTGAHCLFYTKVIWYCAGLAGLHCRYFGFDVPLLWSKIKWKSMEMSLWSSCWPNTRHGYLPSQLTCTSHSTFIVLVFFRLQNFRN